MYLCLNTAANCDIGDAGMTACAVIDATPEQLDYWLGLMDQAQWMSDKLGKATTLAFDDWYPDFYADTQYDGLDADQEDDFDHDGFCILPEHYTPQEPAPQTEKDWMHPPAPGEPCRLSYCELRVHAKGIQWFCGPKYGSAEEYTYTLSRQDCERLRSPQSRSTEGAPDADRS